MSAPRTMAASALGRKPSMSRVDEEDALPLSPNDCLALERSALERNDPPLSYSNPLTHSGTSTDTAILSEDRPLVFVRHRRWHIYLGVALAFLTLVAISVGTAAVVSLAKAGKSLDNHTRRIKSLDQFGNTHKMLTIP